MPDTNRFIPPRRRGLFIHGIAGFLLLFSSGTLFFLALQEQFGTYFVIFLIASLVLLIPTTYVIYRGYALLRADYTLERDGLHLRWGLRSEDIPLAEIEWVRSAADLASELNPPLLSYPGAILGITQSPELGAVEYLASEDDDLVLIATGKRVFAISPQDPAVFIDAVQRAFELGSLGEFQAASTLPVAYLRRVWNDQRARWLVLAGFGLTLTLLMVVAMQIPRMATVSLGFDTAGLPLEPVPARQLLLLPVLAIMFFFANLIAGLYFFRKENQRPIAFMLWMGSVIAPLLLFLALVFII